MVWQSLGNEPSPQGKKASHLFKAPTALPRRTGHPATYTVTNFGNSGTGTLRAAIDLANGTTANDTIVFDIGSSARTINLTSTLPSIEARGTAGKLEIVKQGSATLTLNGNNGGSNRDFRIFNIAAGGDFTLSGVTISGAQTSGSGAAIYNRGGIVSISDCVLTNNIAGSGEVPSVMAQAKMTEANLLCKDAPFPIIPRLMAVVLATILVPMSNFIIPHYLGILPATRAGPFTVALLLGQ